MSGEPFEPWPDDVDVHVEWGVVGARELAAKGFADDLTLAAEVDSTDIVPVWDTTDAERRSAPIRPD